MPKGYFVISETTVNFLRDSFERAVEDLLDDPDGMFPGGEGLGTVDAKFGKTYPILEEKL